MTSNPDKNSKRTAKKAVRKVQTNAPDTNKRFHKRMKRVANSKAVTEKK